MNILVTGGCGGLGQVLVKSLIKHGHNVGVVDPLGEGIASPDYKWEGYFAGSITTTDLKNKYHLVIHLAENLMLDHRFNEVAFHHNTAETISLLKACVQKQIPCWVGCWNTKSLPRHESSILTLSLHTKQLIVNQFASRKTGVIRPVIIPRLIDFTSPSSNYLNILTRIYRMVRYNQLAVLQDDEIYDPQIPYVMKWATLDQIEFQISESISSGSKSQRQPLLCQGITCSIDHAIGILLYELEVDGTFISFDKSKPRYYQRLVPIHESEKQLAEAFQNEFKREEEENKEKNNTN